MVKSERIRHNWHDWASAMAVEWIQHSAPVAERG